MIQNGWVTGLLSLGGNASRLQAAYPDQPWFHRQDWLDSRIPSNARVRLFKAAAPAILLNSLTIPIIAYQPNWLTSESLPLFPAKIGIAFFLLLGIAMIIQTVYRSIQYLKYGDPHFIPDQVPCTLGETLTGEIHTAGPLDARSDFELTLTCVRKIRNGYSVHWKTQSHVNRNDCARLTNGGLRIPVQFHVPNDQPGTQSRGASQRFIWKLAAKAKASGIGYYAEFELPIFDAAAGSSHYAAHQQQ